MWFSRKFDVLSNSPRLHSRTVEGKFTLRLMLNWITNSRSFHRKILWGFPMNRAQTEQTREQKRDLNSVYSICTRSLPNAHKLISALLKRAGIKLIIIQITLHFHFLAQIYFNSSEQKSHIICNKIKSLQVRDLSFHAWLYFYILQ